MKKNIKYQRRFFAVAVFFAASAFSLCGSAEENTAPGQAASLPAETAAPEKPRPLTPDWSRRLHGIKNLTATSWGKPFKKEIYAGMQTADEMRVSLRREIKRQLPPETLDNFSLTFALLGAWRQGLNLPELLEKLMSSSVIGYYSTTDKWLVIVKHDSSLIGALDIFGTITETTLAHELTHALQDQYYDINKLTPRKIGDACDAVTCLMEGDAVWNQYNYSNLKTGKASLENDPRTVRTVADSMAALGEISSEDAGNPVLAIVPGMTEIAEAPGVLRESFVGAYVYGFALVRRIHESGGEYTVDWAFRHPPLSTEQVLHPEKYLTDTPDMPLRFPALLDGRGGFKGVRTLFSITCGELTLRGMLKERCGRELAERAAVGWGGDSAYLVEIPGGTRAAVLISEWDTEKDAAEFAGLMVVFYKRLFKSQPTIEEIETGGRSALWTNPPRGAWRNSLELFRADKRVGVLVNVPAGMRGNFRKTLLLIPAVKARQGKQAR